MKVREEEAETSRGWAQLAVHQNTSESFLSRGKRSRGDLHHLWYLKKIYLTFTKEAAPEYETATQEPSMKKISCQTDEKKNNTT